MEACFINPTINLGAAYHIAVVFYCKLQNVFYSKLQQHSIVNYSDDLHRTVGISSWLIDVTYAKRPCITGIAGAWRGRASAKHHPTIYATAIRSARTLIASQLRSPPPCLPPARSPRSPCSSFDPHGYNLTYTCIHECCRLLPSIHHDDYHGV